MTPEIMKYRTRNTIWRSWAEIVLLASAFVAAFFVRFDLSFDWIWCKRMMLYLPFIVMAEYVSLILTGANKGAWRFVSLSDVSRIVLAILVST